MDIIEFMMKTIFEIIGWVIKTIIKVFFAIISAIFGAIFSKKSDESSEQSSSASNDNSGGDDGKKYQYADIAADIDNADRDYKGDELKERLQYLFYNIYLNPFCTIDERLKLLERIGRKVKTFFGGNLPERGMFYVETLTNTATLLENQFGDPLANFIKSRHEEMMNDVKNQEMKELSSYLGGLLSYAGLINSNEVSMSQELLEKYDLPTWFDE